MSRVPVRRSRLILLFLVVKLHLFLVRLVAARRTPLDEFIPFVELGYFAFQFLLFLAYSFLQRLLVILVRVLDVGHVFYIIGIYACLELLSAALVAVVAGRASRWRRVVIVVDHL